jgi:hypothetical protein
VPLGELLSPREADYRSMRGQQMRREVAAELEVEITAPTTLEFQIAVAPHPNTQVHESLSFDLDGASVRSGRSAKCTATAFTSWTFRSAI